ncbi:MAG: hypothetical protein ACFUZC_10380 [Chthoniobacteraceae bacterium]
MNQYGHFDDGVREYVITQTFRVQRIFRGATYHIEFWNPSGASKGGQQLTVDGKQVESNVIPIQKQGDVVSVAVLLG